MKKVRFSGMGESRQGRVAWVAAVPASPPPLHSLHTSLESLQRDHGFSPLPQPLFFPPANPPSSRQACWLAPAEPTARGSRGQTRSNCAENVGHSTIPQFFFSVLALRYPSAVHLQCGPLSRQIRRRGTEQKREKKAEKKPAKVSGGVGVVKNLAIEAGHAPADEGRARGAAFPGTSEGRDALQGGQGQGQGPALAFD